jgi:transposase
MSQYNYNEELLEIKDVEIINVNKVDNEEQIYIQLKRKMHSCPNCGCMTDTVHDYRNRTIRDVSTHQKPTKLIYRARRYICDSCGKRFNEGNEFVARYYKTTYRLYALLCDVLKQTISMTTISNLYNVSVSCVYRALKLHEFDKISKLPRVLSLDEFKGNAGNEKYHLAINDPENKKILDICKNRDQNKLRAYFQKFSLAEKSQVKYVVIDMWKPYYELSRQLFPKATIVIDRFHYVRQINWALENVRKKVQSTLKSNQRKFFKKSRFTLLTRNNLLNQEYHERLNLMLEHGGKELQEAYKLKEGFMKIVDEVNDSKTAMVEIMNYLKSIDESNLKEFQAARTALYNWLIPICNSFDCVYTNGFTEGKNNKIKVLKRLAYGFRNFDNFRTRILLQA